MLSLLDSASSEDGLSGLTESGATVLAVRDEAARRGIPISHAMLAGAVTAHPELYAWALENDAAFTEGSLASPSIIRVRRKISGEFRTIAN